MKEELARPPLARAPGSGLMRYHHFQVAYATNDIDRACADFGDRFGIRKWQRLEGPTPQGGFVRIELGWAGGTMYELVSGQGAGAEVFHNVLPAGRYALKMHHLGYLVANEEAWNGLLSDIEQSPYSIIHRTSVPGFLQAIIVDVPELGHYLEYIFPEEAGVAFFENTPGN